MKTPRTWRPCPIEQWFQDHPDNLILWNFFDFVEEKSPPFYADEPYAISKKFPKDERVMKLNRNSFRPHEKYDQLRLIAELSGMKVLDIDIDKAFQEVVEWVKEIDKINKIVNPI